MQRSLTLFIVERNELLAAALRSPGEVFYCPPIRGENLFLSLFIFDAINCEMAAMKTGESSAGRAWGFEDANDFSPDLNASQSLIFHLKLGNLFFSSHTHFLLKNLQQFFKLLDFLF